jgi:alkylation response protein AidB-like acyl-CoA dehydrogenase
MVMTAQDTAQTASQPPALTAEERAALIEAVHDFATAELAPHAQEWDQDKIFPRETIRRGGELGLGGIYVREQNGGSGLARRDAVALFEELAKGDPAIAAYISIHNMVAWMIDTYGDDAQRAEWLPDLTSMQQFGAYCLTEPGAGSDAAAITTTAIADGDEYVITGVKQFISGGGEAGVYVVMARTGDPGSRGITAFIVPDGVPGLSFGANE